MYAGHPDQHFGPTTYSQHGEDLLILNLFKLLGVPKPTYLDLGAHHPVDISNTKLLYDRGCRGVNVEANPNLIEAFKTERPGDTNVCIGVGAEPGDQIFHMYSNTSGRNTFSELEVQSLEGVMKPPQRALTLQVVPIKWIVETYCPGGKWPYFLSCDVEGLDIEIMQSADFSDNAPWVICVETRRKETHIMIKTLEAKGFFPYARMGENLIFVLKKYIELVY